MLIIFLLTSCALTSNKDNTPALNNSIGEFRYTDFSGVYSMKREIKLDQGKLISRVKIFSGSKELESTVSVSKFGKSSKSNNKYLLPSISQFKVWFNKKEYFSQIKIDRKTRKLEVLMKSPEKKWQGKEDFTLPKTSYICFFSQIPECLKSQNLLLKAARGDLGLYIIWDNYPYQLEQFSEVPAKPFFYAKVKLDGYEKNIVKYTLDIGNQIISFHFDKNLKYNRMFWVSQGISSISSLKE
jgi:hypothetical protein